MRHTEAVGLVACVALLGGSPQHLHGQETMPLDRAVRLALQTYPSVAAAEARAEGVEAQQGVARSQWFPSLGVSASGTRFQDSMLVAPLHGLDFTVLPEFDRTLYRGNVDLTWTLFEGGGRSARVRGAEARYGSAAARAQGARQDLVARVVNVYTGLLTLRTARDAQRARLVALRAELDRVDRLLAQGRAAEVERYRAEASIARAEADVAELEAGLLARTHELGRLVGYPDGALHPDMLLPVALATADPGPTAWYGESPGDSVPPEILAAQSAVRAAEADHNEASSDWFPRLYVAGGLRSYGGGSVDFTTEWQASVGLEYPVFSGFARSHRVQAASAAEVAAREELRTTELAVADRFDRALEAVRGAAAAAAALSTAERHLVEVVRIERLSLDEGAGVQTDYLRAEAELAETRAARARAINLHIAARAELARARGALTSGWIDSNVETHP